MLLVTCHHCSFSQGFQSFSALSWVYAYLQPIFQVFVTAHLPIKKFLKGSSVGKTCSSNTDVFLETKIFHLMPYSVCLPIMSLLALIWFDTTDVMWSTLHQFIHQ